MFKQFNLFYFLSQIAALTSLSEQSKTTLAEMETNNLQILHKTKESDAKIITKLEAEKLQVFSNKITLIIAS